MRGLLKGMEQRVLPLIVDQSIESDLKRLSNVPRRRVSKENETISRFDRGLIKSKKKEAKI